MAETKDQWWNKELEAQPGEILLCCDRCSIRQAGHPVALIAKEYLVDDPYAHTGALCPDCAREDDPQHIPGSWLLSWTA